MNCSTPGFPVLHYLPEVRSDSCPLSRWCHPTISSSVTPFSSYTQSFPASGSFPVSHLCASGGQSIGAWAPASFIGRPMNIQSWFPLGLTSLVSLLSKGLSRVFASTTVQKYQFFGAQLSFSSVQSLSHVWLFATPWTAAHQASLSITNSWSLLKLMSIESVMPSNRLILCHPLLLLPSIFPSIRGFSNESALCIRWPKYWSFSFNISFNLPMNTQGWSAFFMVYLSHPYMTTGKTIAWLYRTLLAKYCIGLS